MSFLESVLRASVRQAHECLMVPYGRYALIEHLIYKDMVSVPVESCELFEGPSSENVIWCSSRGAARNKFGKEVP